MPWSISSRWRGAPACDLTLDDLDALGRVTPLIANVRPSGKDYLMEDFYYAGGLRALMKQIEERLDVSAMTVTGKTLGETLEGAQVYNDDVIRPLSNPVYPRGLAGGSARQSVPGRRGHQAGGLRSEIPRP